jgi:MFS family permease
MFLLGVSYGFTSTLIGALWPEMYGVKDLGGIRSIIVAAMVLSTAIGPGLTGALIDLGVPLPTQMLFMSAWCLAACLVLGRVSPRIAARNEAPLIIGE